VINVLREVVHDIDDVMFGSVSAMNREKIQSGKEKFPRGAAEGCWKSRASFPGLPVEVSLHRKYAAAV
jgi:hypothetical protein